MPIELAQHFLMYAVIPVWLIAGIADWVCHLVSDIEHNSGTKESVYHLLMLAEIGIPVLLVLFFEVNSLIFIIMFAGLVSHAITAYLDVSYASKTRYVSPIEQHIHSFLEIIPLMAASMIALMHWDQFLALLRLEGDSTHWMLIWKEPALPIGYILWLMAAIVMVEVVPYGEELIRTLLKRKPILKRKAK